MSAVTWNGVKLPYMYMYMKSTAVTGNSQKCKGLWSQKMDKNAVDCGHETQTKNAMDSGHRITKMQRTTVIESNQNCKGPESQKMAKIANNHGCRKQPKTQNDQYHRKWNKN